MTKVEPGAVTVPVGAGEVMAICGGILLDVSITMGPEVSEDPEGPAEKTTPSRGTRTSKSSPLLAVALVRITM